MIKIGHTELNIKTCVEVFRFASINQRFLSKVLQI